MQWYQLMTTLASQLVRLIAFTIIAITEEFTSMLEKRQLTTSTPLGKLLIELKNKRSQTEVQEQKVDLTEAQINMEKMFHKNQLHSRIKQEFIESPLDFRAAFVASGIDPKFGFDLLVQMNLHKRVGLPILVGLLRKHFNGNCQDTTDAILHACENDVMDWHPVSEVFIVKFEIDDEVQQEIDTYQYPLPMVAEPRKVTDNRSSAYYTSSESIILRNNHHDDDVCLDYINLVNSIKLRVNTDTVAFLSNNWKNLDRPKAGEERSEFQKRLAAFKKYDRTSRDVLAHLETTGGEFWLTHKYDKRGRVYCQGYHVSYQGNDWNKACIEFAEGEAIDA